MGRPPAVHVVGLVEFQKEMKAAGREWSAALRKANKAAAEIVVPAAKDRMSSLSLTARSGQPSGKVQAKVAATIKAAATDKQSKVTVGSSKTPYVFGAILGSNRSPQFPAHIGNDWTPGGPGGPYGLGPAVAAKVPDIEDAYGRMLADLFHKAFPA